MRTNIPVMAPMELISVVCLIFSITMVGNTIGQETTIAPTAAANSAALTALEYIKKIRNNSCSGGTDGGLPVQFDHSIWSAYAEVAVRMSNLLTKTIIQNQNRLNSVTEEFLFDLVRNNVDGESLIFGSGIAVEEWVYPRYRTFWPYAYKKAIVFAHDLSLSYNYLDPTTEWYNVLKQKNWQGVYVSENKITYRYNQTAHSKQRTLNQPLARLEDGQWTLPYYDCGGGDIWMVTYSAPIFGMVDNIPTFKGVGTIDIDLTNIDINQCDLDSGPEGGFDEGQKNAGYVNVFRGTHRCQPTTRCVAVTGKGFIPGAYRCVCQDGYYFPDTTLPDTQKYFDGSEIERFFSNASIMSGYRCAECAEGCDTCVDDSPCLYSHILPLRATLLTLVVAVIISLREIF